MFSPPLQGCVVSRSASIFELPNSQQPMDLKKEGKKKKKKKKKKLPTEETLSIFKKILPHNLLSTSDHITKIAELSAGNINKCSLPEHTENWN
jgi:hypothetical protein